MRHRSQRHKVYCALLAALLLGGCSAGPDRAGIVIGVSQCSDDVWREQQNREMARETAFYPGTELRFRSAGDDSEQQVRDIRGLMAEGVDLLVISPNEVGPLTPVVEEAAGRGIPVILVERKVATDRYTTFVGADNDAIGRDAAT
ncbi:MAG: substrate-binding domain-containing protein, partial [Rikenellaceae bacterium]|nr:substrate-binding domain-containing protein [Rikenellaceae bacterium]